MKRMTVILFLVLSVLIGCTGGNGERKQVAISISPKDVTLLLREKRTFAAAVSGTSDQRVNWTTTGGTIDDNGCYHATKLGVFEVRATSKADSSKTAVATVTVLQPGGVDFSDITAWIGTVKWKVNGSWNASGEGDLTFTNKINEDITREYQLEDKSYNALLQCDEWCRRMDSPIEVSGTIEDRSDKSPGEGYCEIDWKDSITVFPEHRDLLSIDKTKGTYTIELYNFFGSPIPCTLYESLDNPTETWDEFLFEKIKIVEQLPLTGMILSGSKVEKRPFSPTWGGTGALDPKELDVTIIWNFTPL